MSTNLVLILAALGLGAFLVQPFMLKSRVWRATITPLASIIGSGFLVAGPVLSHSAGRLAWLAMLGLCGLAYLYGAAVRENIRAREQRGERQPGLMRFTSKGSDLVLALAYFISVAYYLNLFAAFGLRFADITDPFWIRVVATAAIAIIGAIGLSGGLKALENLEIGTVTLKLCVIGGLLAAMAVASVIALSDSNFAPHAYDHATGWDEIRTLLGLVVLVQGFETSRYLGSEYDAETRIRTMRHAQWIATAIYVSFIIMFTHYFTGDLPSEGAETAIIDMLAPLGAAVAPMLIAAALASQSSASIADMNGAGGLINEGTDGRVSVNLGNLGVAIAAIAITWTFDIFEIITHATRAFVAYYALQSLLAAHAAFKRKGWLSMAMFILAIASAVLVLTVAKPAQV